MAEETDPALNCWFDIEFGDVKGVFRECSGLGSEHNVMEFKGSAKENQNFLRQVPGRMKMVPITLKRGITKDDMQLWTWRKQVENGDLAAARRHGTLTMYDSALQPMAQWTFINAWPSKLVGPTTNAGSNDPAVEEVTIVHEGYERKPV